MFWHNFKYSLKSCLKNKSQLIWSIGFVIALGTLFRVSFTDIFEKDEVLKDIAVAVYIENDEVSENFDTLIADISLSKDGSRLMDITYTKTMEEAEKLLKDGEVRGVFYSDATELRLMVAKEDVPESILSSIVAKYHQIVTITKEVAATNPDMVYSVIAKLFTSESTNTDLMENGRDMNNMLSYFYNLLAMTCLMCAMFGIDVTVKNQQNLSSLGARKAASGVGYSTFAVSGLLASIITECVCVVISYVYLKVIGIDFGDEYLRHVLLIFAGCFCGMSIGFMIGSIGKLSSSAKDGLGTTVVIGCSFLSGLMVADMRMIIEDACPVINKINPAALISDSFYALKMFDNYDRFYANILTLAIISIICVILGCVAGRSRKYASV